MRTFVIVCLSVLVAGCMHHPKQSNSTYTPEEVLKKAAHATQYLESAQYVLQGDFDISRGDTRSVAGTARMDGVLQNAGQQVRFQLDSTAEVQDSSGSSTVDGTLEVVMISDDEVYMNLHSLLVQPSNNIFKPDLVGKIASQWWKLPAEDSPPETTSVTPDPRLLQAQSQVVSVSKDRGIVELLGLQAYHYDIELDTDKFIAYLQSNAQKRGAAFSREEALASLQDVSAKGQLWIDASTFHVVKISWDIQSFPLRSGETATAAFTITFRSINSAPSITPPEGVKLFTPEVFFTQPSRVPFPTLVPEIPTRDLPPDVLQELIKQANS